MSKTPKLEEVRALLDREIGDRGSTELKATAAKAFKPEKQQELLEHLKHGNPKHDLFKDGFTAEMFEDVNWDYEDNGLTEYGTLSSEALKAVTTQANAPSDIALLLTLVSFLKSAAACGEAVAESTLDAIVAKHKGVKT